MRAFAESFMGRAAEVMIVALVVVAGLRLPIAAGAEGEAIAVDLKTFTFKVRPESADLFGYNDGEGKLFYYTGGTGETTVKLPADGDYELVIKASCDPALNERAKFKVALDGQPVGMETLLTADDEKDYKLTATVKAGERKLAIEFTNDAYKENEYDRNFYVHGVTMKRVK
jgi:Ca-dependent carbohydrate-binding module xylan-binding